jgi:hypothetical protein
VLKVRITVFSNEETLKCSLIYGECGQSSVIAQPLYIARYLEKTQPSRQIFSRLIKRLCETGSANPRERIRRKTRTDEAVEVAVLGAVANNPHFNTRQIDKLKVILEFVKQVYSALLGTSYPYYVSLHRNYIETILKIVYNFVGAQQQLQTDQTFLNVLFLLMKLHSQITGKRIPEMCTTGPRRTRDDFNRLSISGNGTKSTCILVVGLVVVDQERGPLILLTSHHWTVLMGNSKGHCVPGCSNNRNICANVLLMSVQP